MKNTVLLLALLGFVTGYCEEYSGGAGTEFDPYLISSKQDLLELGVNTNDYDKCFKLIADIDLSGETFTTAVIAPDMDAVIYGFQGAVFSGVFDGNGHAVSNLTINAVVEGNDYLGLFGSASGTNTVIQDLAVLDTSIVGGDSSDYIGGLCGNNSYSTISGCAASGSVTGRNAVGGLCGGNTSGTFNKCDAAGSATGDGYVGGLCGGSDFSTLNECHAIVSVIGDYNVGGLCGSASLSTISGCNATGSATGSHYVGGLCGRISSGTISQCGAVGPVVGNYYAGGLCGYSGGIISKSYATGSVAGYKYIGGLVGKKYTGSIDICYATGSVVGSQYVGGLCGVISSSWGSSAMVRSCYSSGSVSGADYSGGLCGVNYGVVTDSFWDTETSGATRSAGGTGKTTAEMQLESTFVAAGWDFLWETANGSNDVWAMDGYPILVWQLPTYELMVNAGTGDGSYLEGESVLVVADAAGEGWAFSYWTADPSEYTNNLSSLSETNTFFTMAATNVSLTAVFDLWDSDLDGLDDEWEQQIIDADPGDAIETIAQVLPGDDFDNDGVDNVTEQALGRSPVLVEIRITNVSAEQQPGTKRVDISYDVLSDTTNAVTVSLVVSNGIESVNATSRTGDVDGGVAPGVGRVIVWDAETDWNGNVAELGFTVFASDGASNTDSGSNVANVDSRNYTLTIASQYGTPMPSVGADSNYCWQSAVTCSVDRVFFEGGTNYACIGWTGSGSVPASGSSNIYEVVLVDVDSSISWNWEAVFFSLTVNSGSGGGAYSAGTNVEVSAENRGVLHTFSHWTAFPAQYTNNVADVLAASTTFTMPEKDVVLRAVYRGVYSGGAGTVDEPYLIADTRDLLDLAANSDDYNKYFRLAADIDLAGELFASAVIAPDTDSGTYDFKGVPFVGVFDGNGYAISNLSIDTAGANSGYLGLFGYLSGTNAAVTNLRLVDIHIVGGYGSCHIGGLCSWNEDGFLGACSVNGSVGGGGDSYVLGGVVGFNDGGVVDQCQFAGSVEGYHFLGGICGNNYGGSIEYSCADAEVIGSGDYIGGVCGKNRNGEIAHCYATGSVDGNSSVGGLCGYNEQAAITKCYSASEVDYNYAPHGGLCGYNENGSVSGSFWDTQVSGELSSSGGTGKTTAEMQLETTFASAGWDFLGESVNGTNDVWTMTSYPDLLWRLETHLLSVENGTGGGSYFASQSTRLVANPASAGYVFSRWIVEPVEYTNNFIDIAAISTTFVMPDEDVDVRAVYHGIYSGGSGTQNDPLLIGSKQDLLDLVANTDDYDRCLKLTTNIDLAGETFSTAVLAPDTNSAPGFQGTSFAGVFDGNGYVVSNLTINTEGANNNYLGLFGQISGSNAMVADIRLQNVQISAGSNSQLIGGLCGYSAGGTINKCFVDGTVGGYASIGGLCGYNMAGLINESGSDALVDSSGGDVGGLCGYNHRGDLLNCFATGAVTGNSRIGGLCGYNEQGSIFKCYSIGLITSVSSPYGGLCGYNENGSVADCFWDTETSGETGSNGGIGKTTDEMQLQTTFLSAGWDFLGETENGTNNVWTMNGYPAFVRLLSKHLLTVENGTEGGLYYAGELAQVDANAASPGYCFLYWETVPSEYTNRLEDVSGISTRFAMPDEPVMLMAVYGNIYELSVYEGIGGGSFLAGETANISADAASAGYAFLRWAISPAEYTNNIADASSVTTTFTMPETNVALTAVYHGIYSGGTGSSTDPYVISNKTDLLDFAVNTNAYDQCFKMVTDIDLAGESFTTALIAPDMDNGNFAFVGPRFTGSFDGQGHVVSNLVIDTQGVANNYLGLFGWNSGRIRNLGVENVSITGGNYIGGLCGSNNEGFISACHATGALNGGSFIGGLCGFNKMESSYVNISMCYADCIVTGRDNSSVLGGLCGDNVYASISDSYAVGAVSGGANSQDIGGLCGYVHLANVINCYSIGLVVTGMDSTNVGGLCGRTYYGSFNDSFWNTETSGQATSAGGIGKTTLEMQNQSLYATSGWDFVAETANGIDDMWTMASYPVLSWEVGGHMYSLTIEGGFGGGLCSIGSTVPVAANDPVTGYTFSHWTVTPSAYTNHVADLSTSPTTVTIPIRDMTLHANYCPVSVSNMVVLSTGMDGLELEWDYAGLAEAQFRIERRTSSTDWSVLSLIGETSYLDRAVTEGGTLYYRVFAVVAGQDSFAVEEIGQIPTLPEPPARLSASADSSWEVSLSWNEGLWAAGYEIQRRQLPLGGWISMNREPSATAWVDETVEAGKRYAYRMRSVNAGGNSAFGAEVCVAVPADPAQGNYGLTVSNIVVLVSGAAFTSGDDALCGAGIGGAFDVLRSNPEDILMQHRVAVGLRDTNGIPIGTVLEITGLTGVPAKPLQWITDVAVPEGLNLPDESGRYVLWLETSLGTVDPCEVFMANTHTNESGLCKKIVEFTVLEPDAETACIEFGFKTCRPSETAEVPLRIAAAGGEREFFFSISYDVAKLEFASLEAVGNMQGCRIDFEEDNGAVGVHMLLPSGDVLPAGIQEMGMAYFTVRETAAPGEELEIKFSSDPIPQFVDCQNPDLIQHTWNDGGITVADDGFEADVVPRDRPDGDVDDQDRIQIMRFVVGLDEPLVGTEFQRADCAPLASWGDGQIDICDVVVATRYATGAEPLNSSAGPVGSPQFIPMQMALISGCFSALLQTEDLIVESGIVFDPQTNACSRGSMYEVPVCVVSEGAVEGMAFSIRFDSSQLEFLDAEPTAICSNAMIVVNADNAESGQIGFAARLSSGSPLPSGMVPILTLYFRASKQDGNETTLLEISDTPAPMILADADGGILEATLSGSTSIFIVENEVVGVPQEVDDLTAVVEGASSVHLTWSDVSDEDSYVLYRKSTNEVWSLLAELSENTQSYADAGLIPGMQYTYRLASCNGVGESNGDYLIVDIPTLYQVWAAEFIETPDWHKDEDADGDGACNYLEYLMGTDPFVFGNNFLFHGFEDVYGLWEDYYVLGIVLDSFVSLDSIAVETTHDLMSAWNVAPMVGNVESNGIRMLKFRSSQPADGVPVQFIRIKTLE